MGLVPGTVSTFNERDGGFLRFRWNTSVDVCNLPVDLLSLYIIEVFEHEVLSRYLGFFHVNFQRLEPVTSFANPGGFILRLTCFVITLGF